jgi:ABC-type glycerol-3-phosphate transport system permease component
VRRRYRWTSLRWISLLSGAVIVVLTYFPIIFVVSNSLKTGRNIFGSGVFSLFTQFDYQNYSTAWSGVSRPLVNTVIVAAASIVLGVAAAALGAYAFSQLRFRGKELLFGAYVGLLLIFRGFFDQIPKELLESARTDGGTEAQVLMRIVAPLTRPVLLTGAILVTINVWGDYLWPTIVIQDPHRTTISAGVQQFVSSFGLNVSSGGSVFAAFVIATVPMFVLVGFTMRYFVSGLTEGATKL